MEIRVLGPLEAFVGASPLPLPGGKSRALLARLALDANRTVSVERLVDDLWGEAAPPRSAPKMVQIYVSQLRKVLPPDVLRTRPPGYVIDLDPEVLDVTRFARLRSAGRAALGAGDASTAAANFRDALALWRGQALAEFPEPFARVEGAHLEELRLQCIEDRIEADLAAGRHADVIGELEASVVRHPLREALHRQLMLALYRAGRHAEALAAYERYRRTLDEELAIEPSAAMKELQHNVLNQASALELTPGDGGALKPGAERRAERAAVPRTGFAGRVEELAVLADALDAAGEGHGNAVLIAGPAGIGKTRLVDELAALARARGATVLGGRSIQLVGSGLPYLPLVDALRPITGEIASMPLAVELRELPRLLPELGRETGSAPAGHDRTDGRLHLFDEVLTVLDRLGAAQPLVLVLEDLHWADESTLDLVAYLVHAARERRLLVLATYRSDEVRPGDHLHRLATGLVGTAAVSLPLGPLALEDVERLLVTSPSETLPHPLFTTIVKRSGGNPFFASELLAAAMRGETALPAGLRDVLLGRLAQLEPGSRSVLRVCAVAGRDTSYRLLAAVLPIDELELAEALRHAVERDVLVSDQTAGTFRFRHDLFSEAVYGTLLPGEREVLHERLARALDEEPALAPSDVTAAELAQHWASAGRPVEALAASLRAAREAEAVSGLTEALHHVERVLELWDEVPGAEQMAGAALPAMLAWAAELAGMSVQREDEVDARRLVGVLGPDQSLDVETVATRLGVGREAAAQNLAALERDGLVEQVADGVYRSAPLAVAEARRLYPSVVVLESLAVRQSPPFHDATLATLRDANDRFRAARNDPAAAIAADDDFHRALTAGCGNEHLLAALRPVRRALLRYERVYMLEPERIERSALQHDLIVQALQRGDHAAAAQRVRENLAGGLPDLREALET
jgi:DNA-binding SARP family transcriptional activator/DNA-binding GntR family transcriptional regulator